MPIARVGIEYIPMQEGSSKKADGPTGISQKYRVLQTTNIPFRAMLIKRAENIVGSVSVSVIF